MPTDSAVFHARLSEMVAHLSGRPQVVACDAVHDVVENTDGDDPLLQVAAALVLLRRAGT